MEHNHETRNFDRWIGEYVRGLNKEVIGTITEIDYSVDGWGHSNAWAILDNGRRINCRTMAD